VKLNRQQKGYVALGVVLVLLGYMFYSNVLSDSSTPGSSSAARVAAPDAVSDDAAPTREQIASRGRDEFLPVLRAPHAKPLDPTTVDPTLHVELLAKLLDVPPAGSGRDLFSFGKPAPVLAGPEAIVKPLVKPVGPPPPPPKPVDSGPPKPPPPPPINLKYYGIVTTLANGHKTAFFMDGDEILLETEGVTFKGRYRLVRIGVNSAVVEDIQYKHEQTLPLTEDAQG